MVGCVRPPFRSRSSPLRRIEGGTKQPTSDLEQILVTVRKGFLRTDHLGLGFGFGLGLGRVSYVPTMRPPIALGTT
jgi:hypothetical protein